MDERIYKLMCVCRQKNDWVDGFQLSRLCIVFCELFHKHFCYFVALFFDEDAVRWVGNFNALQVVVFDRCFFVLNRCFFDACSCEAE